MIYVLTNVAYFIVLSPYEFLLPAIGSVSCSRLCKNVAENTAVVLTAHTLLLKSIESFIELHWTAGIWRSNLQRVLSMGHPSLCGLVDLWWREWDAVHHVPHVLCRSGAGSNARDFRVCSCEAVHAYAGLDIYGNPV